ncbi:PAS domain-containing protein [Streptomyces sp. NPDC050610]|uniref:PAS domain-containing protein n=1 Tax=Streptomyces sp. NPDC050610 TaxID=3157097 RepID=UPI00343F4C2E
MSSRPSRGAARLAAILDALPDALLLVNCNGTVVNANHIALETFEVPGTGLVGRGLLDLLPDFDSRRIPGSMRRMEEQEGEGGRTKPTRMVARRTDGTQFPVEVTSANLEDGRTPYADHHPYTGDELLMLVVRDLTGTLDTEAELARQQRQTEMILRAAAEGVVGVDTAGKVVLVNPSAAQILGYRASDLGGRELHPLIQHSRVDGSPFPYEESAIADTLRSGRKHRVRSQVLWAKDGRSVAVDLTTAPVRDGDQLVGAVMTFTDRRAYDTLAERHAQLLAVLGESLRGPLEQLRAELGTLAADPAGQLWPEANQVLHHLTAGYARMTTLVDNVLSFQRLDAGADRLEREKVSLDTVVAAGVEGAIELIGPGRAQFAVHAPPIDAEVDAERLAQALAHLIADVAGVDSTGNSPSQSHSPAGSGSGPGPGAGVGAADSTIVVAAAQRGEVVRIEVRGPYPGGDPVHGPIVRGIVRRHGGVLQTHEVPGAAGGSAYVLEVPISAKGGPVPAGPERLADRENATTVMPMPAQRARGTGARDGAPNGANGANGAGGSARVEGGLQPPRAPQDAQGSRGSQGPHGGQRALGSGEQQSQSQGGGRRGRRGPEADDDGNGPDDASGGGGGQRRPIGPQRPGGGAGGAQPGRGYPQGGADGAGQRLGGQQPGGQQSGRPQSNGGSGNGGGEGAGSPMPPHDRRAERPEHLVGGSPAADNRRHGSATDAAANDAGSKAIARTTGGGSNGPGAGAGAESGPGDAAGSGQLSGDGRPYRPQRPGSSDPAYGPGPTPTSGQGGHGGQGGQGGQGGGPGGQGYGPQGSGPGAGHVQPPAQPQVQDQAQPQPTGRRRARRSPQEEQLGAGDAEAQPHGRPNRHGRGGGLEPSAEGAADGRTGHGAPGEGEFPPPTGRRARRDAAQQAQQAQEGQQAQQEQEQPTGRAVFALPPAEADRTPQSGLPSALGPTPPGGLARHDAGQYGQGPHDQGPHNEGPHNEGPYDAGRQQTPSRSTGRRARRALAEASERAVPGEGESEPAAPRGPFALPPAAADRAPQQFPEAQQDQRGPFPGLPFPGGPFPGSPLPGVGLPGGALPQARSAGAEGEARGGGGSSRPEDDESSAAMAGAPGGSGVQGGGGQGPWGAGGGEQPSGRRRARRPLAEEPRGERDEQGERGNQGDRGGHGSDAAAPSLPRQMHPHQQPQPLPADPGSDPNAPAQGQGQQRSISVRTLGQGAPFARQMDGGQRQPTPTQAPTPAGGTSTGSGSGSGRRRKLGTPPDTADRGALGADPTGPQGQPHGHTPSQPHPQPQQPHQPPHLMHASEGRAYAIGAPDEGAAEGPEPLDGPNGAVEVHDEQRPPMDDELPPEPLDNPRRLLVWPAPDVTTQQALSDRGYRPVIVHSREEVDAQIAAYPAALFVDPLTGPITRTALQSLRQAAVAAEVPVLVTAGLGQATREAAYGADPAVLLKALAPRDSEQHPPRVLLIEEQEPIAEALTSTLERRGMQVGHAATDADAVALAAQIRPNLVVMDLLQVRRRRAGIVDWLRGNGLLNRTPLVVYTSADLDPAQLPRLASGETVLFLAERSTSAEVQGRIVDLLAKIGNN